MVCSKITIDPDTEIYNIDLQIKRLKKKREEVVKQRDDWEIHVRKYVVCKKTKEKKDLSDCLACPHIYSYKQWKGVITCRWKEKI